MKLTRNNKDYSIIKKSDDEILLITDGEKAYFVAENKDGDFQRVKKIGEATILMGKSFKKKKDE